MPAKLIKSLQKALKEKKTKKDVAPKKEEEQKVVHVDNTETKGKKVIKPSSGKKGKKFVDNAAMLQLINDINSVHDHEISVKKTAEQLKREARLAHQKRQEEAREARKGKKEKRLSELKDQVREQKQKLEETEKGVKKEESKMKPNKKGKRVTFAS